MNYPCYDFFVTGDDISSPCYLTMWPIFKSQAFGVHLLLNESLHRHPLLTLFLIRLFNDFLYVYMYF